MSTWIDLAQRLESGIGNDDRLHVESAYHGAKLPAWLSRPIDEAAAHCDGRVPIVVLNWKTSSCDGALVAMSLADFEQLINSK